MLWFFLFVLSSALDAKDLAARFETCKASTTLRNTPLCDVDQPLHVRASDLVGRLTLDEKVSLVDWITWKQGVPRIQLSAIYWGQEALHGLAYCGATNFSNWKVTSFPQIINVGRTFDLPLFHEIGVAIAEEGRALSNLRAIDTSYWAPNINIFRDPRWGRGQETPGEDPWLTSRYAYEFITGIQQGESFPKYLKGISTLKHYTAYDLENWHGVDRFHFNAIVSPIDLAETYQLPFKTAVTEAGAMEVMCSYPALNGVPNCANVEYLGSVLREEWGFEGFVVSDCGAVGGIQTGHKYASTPENAVQDALLAGVDLNCGSYYGQYMVKGIQEGIVNASLLDQAIFRLTMNRLRMGEFDPWETQPYRKISTDVISSKEHKLLSLTLARESLVLLKNEGNALPLEKQTVVAVIGPNANITTTLQGDYSGPPPFLISPLQGISLFAKSVVYSKGCDIATKSTTGFKNAINSAKSADATVLLMGLDLSQETEGKDRDSLAYPGVQLQLIEAIADALKGSGKPLVVVNFGGGPIDTEWVRDSMDVHALVEAGYPSQSGGTALADVLFGNISPSGRLTVTVYPASFADDVSYFDMQMRPDSAKGYPGRGYRFYTGKPVYDFGHGLTYTTWKYAWFDASERGSLPLLATLSKEELLRGSEKHLAVNVTNTGSKWTADDAVLAFITNEAAEKTGGPIPPKKQLFGAQRVKSVKPGETRTVRFTVAAGVLERVNEDGTSSLLAGTYILSIGPHRELLGRVVVV